MGPLSQLHIGLFLKIENQRYLVIFYTGIQIPLAHRSVEGLDTWRPWHCDPLLDANCSDNSVYIKPGGCHHRGRTNAGDFALLW